MLNSKYTYSNFSQADSDSQGLADVVERHQVIPAAYVYFRREDEVLLQLRHNTGYMDGCWAAAAAGHIEAGESAQQAACREVREEVGLHVTSDDLVPKTTLHRTQGDGTPINERADFFFECWRWEGTPQIVEKHKAADLRWFSLGELPSLMPPHERFVLTQLQDNTLPPILTFGFPVH